MAKNRPGGSDICIQAQQRQSRAPPAKEEGFVKRSPNKLDGAAQIGNRRSRYRGPHRNDRLRERRAVALRYLRYTGRALSIGDIWCRFLIGMSGILVVPGLIATPPALAGASGAYTLQNGFDGVSGALHQVTDSISVGAALEFAFEAELNTDLGVKGKEDKIAIEPELFLKTVWQPTGQIDLVAELELTQKLLLKHSKKQPDFRIVLRRAYATFRDLAPNTTIVIGRQNFVDKRKWIWEEPLDGVRLIWKHRRVALEVAAARDELVTRDLLGRRDGDGGNYYWGAGHMTMAEHHNAMLYVLFVDNNERYGEDLMFTGVQLTGNLNDKIEYWLDSALVSGEAYERDVLGLGIDLGVTWAANLPLNPAFSLGFALGTGDDGSGTDTAFRQTGLEENSGRFAGIASFEYYGEVFDPELSNLAVVTAGVGIRPTKNSSVDLIYHRYHQPVRSDELRDVDIKADPTGESAALGNEIDVVVGWKATDRVRFKAFGGVFFPGRAFDGGEPAWSVGSELRITF